MAGLCRLSFLFEIYDVQSSWLLPCARAALNLTERNYNEPTSPLRNPVWEALALIAL